MNSLRYADDWYEKVNDVECTAEQMSRAVEGHFTTEIQMLTDETRETISGLTAQEFINNINATLRHLFPSKPIESIGGYVEAPLAYDATWALALSLNLSLQRTNLEEWTYENTHMKEIMYVKMIRIKIYDICRLCIGYRMEDMEQTDFFGVSGGVKFDKLGNRMSKVVVEQLRSILIV